jgi:CDGSH-type Zn-finger protein
MSEAKIAATQPIAVEISQGTTYYWCSCGRSATQPFCDGAHQGSDFAPLPFTPQKSGTAYLCQCKRSKNPPYCDGAHKGL